MNKKIGLIDVDSKWKTHGNLALMKISAYHKQQGDKVEGAAGPLYIRYFDTIYASSLFTTSEKFLPHDAIKGGPGFINEGITATLPPEIEDCDPDYQLYSRINFSYQRYSKGCINHCPFCVVPRLEGAIAPQKPMALNPKGKYIYILDNNFFGNPQWKEAVAHLKSCKQPVHWEGVDIRILTDAMVESLFSVRLYGRIHIAWDNLNEDIPQKIKDLFPPIRRHNVMCYVLIGYNSKPEEDLYRVETLRSLGIDPFIMPYDRKIEYQRNFTRWCNIKSIWKSVSWNNYKKQNGRTGRTCWTGGTNTKIWRNK